MRTFCKIETGGVRQSSSCLTQTEYEQILFLRTSPYYKNMIKGSHLLLSILTFPPPTKGFSRLFSCFFRNFVGENKNSPKVNQNIPIWVFCQKWAKSAMPHISN